jgi:outer membrane protein
MMRVRKEAVISGLILMMILLFLLFLSNGIKKEGYIYMVKLNAQFELKLHLQKELDKELNTGHLIVDNLKLEVQRIYNDSLIVGNERFVTLKQLQTDIETKIDEYAQKEQELTEKYNTQIWAQLNEYLKLYGIEKDIDILFGAAGQGTILYGKEEYDLTEECIAFVNKKYGGE